MKQLTLHGFEYFKNGKINVNKIGVDYTSKTYKGVYYMHKYWSKKPFDIIRRFILRYTNRGDIVLDPFCGSGVTISESIFTGRKAVGIDINPSAIFITKQTINKINPILLEKEFKKLESRVKPIINSFYIVKRKNKQYIGTHFLWNGGELIEVWYKDGKKRVIDKPTEDDIKLANSFSVENIPYYYPKERLFYNSRINADGKYVYELFTPRNLMGLSILMNEIEKIENKEIRDFFKFCFTASLGQASKMVFVVKKRGKLNGKVNNLEKKEVGSWVIGYWIPKEHFEINVWNCFENKYKKIINAKKQQYKMDYVVMEGRSYEELINTEKNLLLINEPAQKALKKIPDNSIDYVITDPPHGDRLPYLELSMLWNSWLKKEVNYEDEIVISDSKERKKDKNEYYKLLNVVFSEIERVLKENHYFSLMFNSLDDEIWINLFKIMNNLNFRLENVETFEYSAGSVVQDTRKGGLKTDFIITYKKTKKQKKPIELISVKKERDKIIELISNNLKDGGLYTYQIINLLTVEYLKQNKFFKLSEVLKLLKSEFVMENNVWVIK